MIKKIVSLLFCISLTGHLFGLTEEDNRRLLLGFDEVVEKAMKDFDIPGVAIGLSLNGKTLKARGYGYRRLRTHELVDTQTLFAIGSCTKAFTSFVLGTLVDEKKATFDDPVRNYMPTFRLYDDYATAHLTLRDMLSHRSGYPSNDFIWYGSHSTREEMVLRMRYLKPVYGLREKWLYNNLMYLAAGLASEKITGKTWEENVQERILRPLGMTNTIFSTQEALRSGNVASPYIIIEGEVREIPFRDMTAIGPAGSIMSNLDDMMKWAEFQLSDGQGIIAKETLKELHKPQMIISTELKDNTPSNANPFYALGWGILSRHNRPMILHGGSIDGFNAMVAIVPEDGLAIVILVNQQSTPISTVLLNYILDQLYLNDPKADYDYLLKKYREGKETSKDSYQKSLPVKIVNAPPSHPISDYAGTFENPGYGSLYISADEDKLTGTFETFIFSLLHWHYDYFVAGDTSQDARSLLKGCGFLFRTNEAGRIDRVEVPLEPLSDPIVFIRKE